MTPRYEPKPDSVAFRALEFLQRNHADGTEVSSAQLAEGSICEPQALQMSLSPAIRAKRIFRRQKGGHPRSPIFWSLKDHNANGHATLAQAIAPVEGAEERTPKDCADKFDGMANVQSQPLVTQVEITHPISRWSFTSDKPRIETPAEVLAELTTSAEAKPEVQSIDTPRVALWNDGVLAIQRATGELIEFKKHEARAIVDYLFAIDLGVLEDDGA